MVYVISTSPDTPTIEDTIYISVSDGVSSLNEDNYRCMLVSVPDASILDGYMLLPSSQFIPDVAGTYTIAAIITTTTYNAPKYSGDNAETKKIIVDSITSDVAVLQPMVFDIQCLGNELNVEIISNSSGVVIEANFVESDLSNPVVQSFIADSNNQWALSQCVGSTIGSDFHVDLVDAVNTFKTKFNLHISDITYHSNQDTDNTINLDAVSNIGEAIVVLNKMKENLRYHETNADGNYHSSSDSNANIDYVPAASNPQSAYILLSFLNYRYLEHLLNTTIHLSADTSNGHVLGDKFSTLIRYFIDYVVKRNITPAGSSNIGDVNLRNIGFMNRKRGVINVSKSS